MSGQLILTAKVRDEDDADVRILVSDFDELMHAGDDASVWAYDDNDNARLYRKRDLHAFAVVKD